MKHPTPPDIRRKVLKERGITSFQPERGKQRRLKPVPQPTIDPKLKTPMMRYLELVHGEPIEKMLMAGSLSVVAKRLDNTVDTSTLSKWIKRLKLRYTADNLPNCNRCASKGPACESGVCYILIELELYNLLQIKKKEMMND